MRITAWLLVIGLGISFAVDKSNFKTCDQSSFCKRHRSLKPGSAKFIVKPESVKLDDKGAVFAELEEEESKHLLGLHLLALSDHTFRLKIYEIDGLRPRFSPKDALAGDLAVQPLKLDKSTTTTKTYRTQDGADKLVLAMKPSFRLDAYSGDDLVISFNSQRLLKFEHFRRKAGQDGSAEKEETTTAAPDADSKSEEDEEDPDKDHNEDGEDDGGEKEKVPGEDNPPVAKKEESDGGSDDEGMWEETFKSHRDSKPFGPSSIGFDVSFIGFDDVFGIPEHADAFSLKTTTGTGQEPYRLYNLDVFEYELDSRMALYGSVPYMIAQSVSKSVGVFWLNAAEMWIDIKSTTADKSVLSKLAEKVKGVQDVPQMDTHWMAESGLIDVFFFMGPGPYDVFRQYAAVTGVTPLPPLWALGYHQCRWNYNDQDDVKNVLQGFEEHEIPMDVIWLDIEHTDSKKYFTWDRHKFSDSKAMLDGLVAKGRKMVVIVDPHIKKDDGYDLYKVAKDKGYFVKDRDGNDLDGWCWPGSSAYLDFLNPVVREYWSDHYQLEKYEGSTNALYIWNDMNEPSVFNGPEITMHKDCKHYGGWEHRDIHNMYGFYNHRSTFQGLINRSGGQLRPFVLTRSFFSGSQRYGSVWTGDNTAEWSHLAASIPMLLSLSVGGIPFVGADVGGFFGNPDEELLVRWYQTAAFTPFFRAHAHIDTKRREPWLFSEDTKNQIRDAISIRYKFLPYWYTLFYEHTLDGRPVMRPLWAEFPNDKHSIDCENQFLVGNAILVRPVTEAGVSSVSVYLPGEEAEQAWYQYNVWRQSRGSGAVRPETPISRMPFYLRGGTIIPVRERVRRSAALMNNDPITLYISISYKGDHANGTLYLDDGQSYRYKNGEYIYRSFHYEGSLAGGTITSKNLAPKSAQYVTPVWIERIVLLGMRYYPETVVIEYGGGQRPLSHKLHQDTMSLVIRKPGVKVSNDFKITLS